ncbi:MAG: protease complex subunit PrcB family protein [Phycisphaeraceae bacterium]
MRNCVPHVLMPLLAITLLFGCESDGPSPQAAGPAPQRAQPVRIVEQIHGDDPALQRTAVLWIRAEDEQDVLGSDALADLDVDFETQDVIVVAVGEVPTGGHWAYIDSVDRVGDVLNVNGRVNRPAADEAVTQAMAHPFAAAVIEKTRAATLHSGVYSVEGESFPGDDE